MQGVRSSSCVCDSNRRNIKLDSYGALHYRLSNTSELRSCGPNGDLWPTGWLKFMGLQEGTQWPQIDTQSIEILLLLLSHSLGLHKTQYAISCSRWRARFESESLGKREWHFGLCRRELGAKTWESLPQRVKIMTARTYVALLGCSVTK